MIFIVTARMPIWSGTLDTATKAESVFNSDIFVGLCPDHLCCPHLPVVTPHSDKTYCPGHQCQCQSRPITLQWVTSNYVCSGHLTTFWNSLSQTDFRTHLFDFSTKYPLLFPNDLWIWIPSCSMFNDQIVELTWMRTACAASQGEGPWCFDLRDDGWHSLLLQPERAVITSSSTVICRK